ncbi:MAG TPA: hypothetical protein VHH36_09325, partial [Candidatus Thermoplasmatota archaeon]|nr:hypothetical protein [Candidatus Thermoplasmatota archaeon]
MDPNAKTWTIACVAAMAALLAAPLASASLSIGVDAASVDDVRAAGATPAYGQIWVGTWTNSANGWASYESALRDLRDQGVTPVVMWYYWGDGISVDAVKYGRDGKSLWQWNWMAEELARRADGVLDWRPFYVVLEPEFNKNGIQSWETFDGYLAEQAQDVKREAPNARVVVGFGHWGGWDLFDRAMAASDLSGFQQLRASTRDSSSEAIGLADEALRITRDLKGRFGKGVLLYDLGVATYGNWEWVQEKSLQRFSALSGDLERAGLKGVVWRYLRDNSYSSGYFGAAESSWGVLTSWGSKKAGFDDLMALMRGSSTSTSSTSTPSTSTAPSSAFSDVKGNEWWIQATVAGSPARVEARVNGGAWGPLAKQPWGAWAVSKHAPTGSTVELRATYGDGSSRSASYPWPPGASSSSFDASFSGVDGNAWWIQASVSANQPL